MSDPRFNRRADDAVSDPDSNRQESDVSFPQRPRDRRRGLSFCGTNRGIPPPPGTPALPKPDSGTLPRVKLGPDRRVPRGWYTRSDLAAVTGRSFGEIVGLERHSAIVPVAVVDGTLPFQLFDDTTVELIAKLPRFSDDCG